MRQLKQFGDFSAAAFVNLDAVARKAGINNHGLRGMCATLLGFRISKQSKLSNWARSRLTPEQIMYAATDAWASRELYLYLEKNDTFDLLIRQELDECSSAAVEPRPTSADQRRKPHPR